VKNIGGTSHHAALFPNCCFFYESRYLWVRGLAIFSVRSGSSPAACVFSVLPPTPPIVVYTFVRASCGPPACSFIFCIYRALPSDATKSFTGNMFHRPRLTAVPPRQCPRPPLPSRIRWSEHHNSSRPDVPIHQASHHGCIFQALQSYRLSIN